MINLELYKTIKKNPTKVIKKKLNIEKTNASYHKPMVNVK